MSELHEQESEFTRLLQRLPGDDAPRPEHAGHLREQVLARFDEGQVARPARPWWKRVLTQGREIMRRPIPRLIAATACAAVILAWLLLPGHLSTAQAFNMFADTIVQAKTAKFQMEVAVEGQPKQKFQAWYMAPAKFRQELGFMVNIADFEAGKIVSLMPKEKKAMIMNLKGRPKKKTPGNYYNYFDELRKLLQEQRDATDEQFEKLGEKEIAGKKAVGFRSSTAAATVTLWGDPQTKQPLRIETVWTGMPRTETVMTDFVMNVELKTALFDQTPPAGYKVQSIDVDASDPTEHDLLAAFKACAEISGGEFPDTLDTAGVNGLIIHYALKAKAAKNISDEKIQALMKETIKIGRGFMFIVQLPESAEPTYAGKGVKRDAKQRPIFWYKPAETAKYRVIFADLTVHDADRAPQVAGAKRIERGSAIRKSPE
jgi:outer membrane lipoprotein-sorting protein